MLDVTIVANQSGRIQEKLFRVAGLPMALGRGEGQWCLKRNAKGTEALERKKRAAKKGQIMVGLQARKEDNQKHKVRFK
ncbi:hypothetical protein Tco_0285000 [Tanacetum coccineum]